MSEAALKLLKKIKSDRQFRIVVSLSAIQLGFTMLFLVHHLSGHWIVSPSKKLTVANSLAIGHPKFIDKSDTRLSLNTKEITNSISASLIGNEPLVEKSKSCSGNEVDCYRSTLLERLKLADSDPVQQSNSLPYERLVYKLFFSDTPDDSQLSVLLSQIEEIQKTNSKDPKHLNLSLRVLQQAALERNHTEIEREDLLKIWERTSENVEVEQMSEEERLDYYKNDLLLAQFKGDVDLVRDIYALTRELDPNWKGATGIDKWLSSTEKEPESDPWILAQKLTTDEERRTLVLDLTNSENLP